MEIPSSKPTAPVKTCFAEVALPIPATQTFTYTLPTNCHGQSWLGHRVVVPFRNQLIIGVICSISTSPPPYTVKPILEIPDKHPIWTPQQCTLLQWMATYYMVGMGSMVKVAIAGVRMLFQPAIDLLTEDHIQHNLTPAAKKWLALLAQERPLGGTALKKHIKTRSDWKTLQELVALGLISLVAPLAYQPPKQNHIILAEDYQATSALTALKKHLAKKGKQRAVFQHYLTTSLTANNKFDWMPLTQFQQGDFSKAAIDTLVRKGIFIKVARPLITPPDPHIPKSFQLTEKEKCYYPKVVALWEKKPVVLLWGKEVAENVDIGLPFFFSALPEGHQGLYLVPKHALTADWIKKVTARFGQDQVAFYEDSLRDRKKHWVWDQVAHNKVRWVIGTHSALFLPFRTLARVVVSSSASKQYSAKERRPVFHARDVAIMLAHLHKAETLLTAHLPSLESYYNVKTNKYAACYLPGQKLPHDVLRIVVNHERIAQQPHPLSKSIRNEIANVLTANRAVIILHHRRGYATYNSCLKCRWIAQCPYCKSSLTFHENQQQLYCHFCAYSIPPYPACPACKDPALQQGGIGIAQLVALLPTFFPNKKVICIENEAQAAAYAQGLKAGTQQQASIIVATPHLIDWFPLNKKSLVVIPDIDRWLRMRHFKAGEWCYQWLAQLSSHAHLPERDMIWLQTTQYKRSLLRTWVGHIQLQQEAQHYDKLLVERTTYGYPPYTKRLKIILQHADPALLYKVATRLMAQLQPLITERIVGPTPEGRFYPKAPCVASLALNIPRQEASTCKQKLYNRVQQLQLRMPYAKVKINFIVDSSA